MKKISTAVLAAAFGLAACENIPREYMDQGVAIGAVSGAVIGATAYSKNRSKGAIVGAIGGGIAGGAVGAYMDNQKRDLEKNLAKEIQAGEAKVDKMPNDVVRVTMTSQTAFDTNSTAIKPSFHSTLDKLADVMSRYNKTTLTVVGHTDNVGTDKYNQDLSQRRAYSVAQYFESRKINPVRLATAGKGETEPVASNTSDAGRQLNRRVEIYVEPVREG
jgi:outer membrane protein OmpA-like peptidoglycan-associated protein